jgi:hypothetical protein
MAEGLKSYTEFKKFIADVGFVKTAWFTTFNLNLDFFEKYVLAALVKTNPFDLKNIKDFEALNDRIVNAEGGSIDVKVFHDYRALQPTVKRTSIQTIAIKPQNLGASFSYGVFHPKVCLLINDKDEAWILTGSANLTLSAWSRNSEGIVLKKIEGKENAQSITDFFRGLLQTESEREKIRILNIGWQKTLKENSNWNFIHSLSEHKLVNYLKEKSCDEMLVWSPYFSDDFSDIIKNDLDWVTNINVIPDLTAAGAIRLPQDNIIAALETHKLTLQKDLFDYGEEVFVHAKIWCTPRKIAIGSWNFTKAGLNLSQTANNIEAGIVESINPEIYASFKKSCQLISLEKPKGMNQEDINAEKRDFLSDWKINCQIYADWSNYQYTLESVDDLSTETLYFSLPGLKNRVAVKELLAKGLSFYNEHKSVLKDRLYTVYDQEEGGTKVYIGVLLELNPIERPAVGFNSLNDLLRAWGDRKPETKSQYHQMNFSSDIETGEELSLTITNALKGDYSNAWFTMFLAFEQMKIRIEGAKEDTRELSMIGYRIPGSVSQLAEHLLSIKEVIDSEKNEMSRSFIWFMINEANHIITTFNKYNLSLDLPKIEKVENITLDFKNVNKTQMKKWLGYIQNSCSY